MKSSLHIIEAMVEQQVAGKLEEKPRISVVIPVYNSAEILPELVRRLENVLSSLGDPFEVLLVNDGSQDQSWRVIQEQSQRYVWIRGIDLMRNYGQHNALLCGIRRAAGEIIVTMDDDLQHPPEEIPNLLEALSRGYDVVYGTPRNEQHSLWRTLASQVTKMALKGAMGVETARMVSAFRVFRASLRDAFGEYEGPYVSIDVLLGWATTRFTAVCTRHDPRLTGRSQYTFRRLLRHTFNMLTGFSAMPLRLASLTGFVFTLFGMLILIYVVAVYFVTGGSVPGFPFLASIVAIFSGAQLFALGIIGEYIARIHFRTMKKPSYAVRAVTDGRHR